MTGGEDQPQHLITNVVIEGRVEIGHRVLLGLQRHRDHRKFAGQHRCAAQMLLRAASGGGHQPSARTIGNAGLWPPFQRRDERILGQFLSQRHVAQHPTQAGGQPGLLDPPCGKDRAVDIALRPAGRQKSGAPGHRAGNSADFTGAFPAGHMVLVHLHEFSRGGESLVRPR